MPNISALSQIVFEVQYLSRTRNICDFRKLEKMTGSAKFEIIITQKLFELQPYGLTCVVILTCGLIGIFYFFFGSIQKY